MRQAPKGEWQSLPGSDEVLYEVVNGQRLEAPCLWAHETHLASILNQSLGMHARTQALGRVVVEMLFLLDSASELQRRPDVAFVSYQRWPRNRRLPRSDAWEVVPELGVEIVSTRDVAEPVEGKVQDYFRTGVQRVWVIYPDSEQVHVYDSPTQIRVLMRNDELDGGAFLPGF